MSETSSSIAGGDNNGDAEPQQRRRRYHQRSRNGCKTCKARHVRCDQRRPLCSNCLRSGGDCGYGDPFVLEVPAPARDQALPRSSRAVATPLNPLPKHSFVGFPIELPERSRWLLQTFAKERGIARLGISGSHESSVVHRALSNLGCLHGTLTLAAVEWIWSARPFDQVKLPLYYHRTEAYRYIGERLANPSKATEDDTIVTIATVALIEAALAETSPQGSGGIVTHLTGLQNIMRMVSGGVSQAHPSLFQRFVRMSVEGIAHGSIGSRRDNYDEKNYLPACISVLFISMYPIPDGNWYHDRKALPAAVGRDWFQNPSSPGGEAYIGFQNGVPSDPVLLRVFNKSSHCAFFTCFLYLTMLLRRGKMNSYILAWLIEQSLDDLNRTQPAFLGGACNQPAWLWTCLFGISAVASATATNELERREILLWRRAANAKIRLASSTLGLHDWDSAKAVLRAAMWVDGFDGEEETRTLWENAVLVPP